MALRAKLANLLQVVAGVHVHLGKVEIDIKGVEAQAQLKVRLENLYDILDRALSTLDRRLDVRRRTSAAPTTSATSTTAPTAIRIHAQIGIGYSSLCRLPIPGRRAVRD